MSGFVYFIACGDRVKIGYSEDPVKRLTKINADSPMPCDLLGYVSALDFPEAELHERFAAVRLHSEWFALTSEIRAFIDSTTIGKGRRADRFDRVDLAGASPLKRWRVRQKLSQHEAAERIGVHTANWNKWETGASKVSATKCLAVSLLTGIPVEQLRPDVFLHANAGATA